MSVSCIAAFFRDDFLVAWILPHHKAGQVWFGALGSGQARNHYWISPLDWTLAIARLIDLQTFTSVWYWLVVIVTWSIAGNWLIGVPFDMLYRARNGATQELMDLEALTDINVRRILWTDQKFGTAMAVLIGFILCSMGVAGFFYGLEIGQGLFILAAPLTVILAVNLRLAQQLGEAPLTGIHLVKRLFEVRLWTQVVAMLALFFTALYGMYYAISAQVLF